MATLENDPGATIAASIDETSTPVVSLGGELDISTVPNIEAELNVIASGKTRVVIDLSQLSFMDSSGVAMLLRLREHVGTVTVVNPSRNVERLMQVTGLTHTFAVPDD